jgi:flagellar basal-body rod protein FlgG
MEQVLAVTLASMHQDMNRMDRVALNVANLSTPGYKREVAASRPFVDFVDQTDGVVRAADSPRLLTPALTSAAAQVLLDTRPGTVKLSGQTLDLALAGDGFFEVSTETGPAYTRQGSFRVDARGRLVTAQGLPVMGKSGEIYLTTQTPVIDAAGNITEPDATTGPSAVAPGTPIAQIKVVRFDNAKSMQRLGNGLMEAGQNMTVVNETDAQIRQGALESSNVDSAVEMVQMMQTMRHFETMQKITQGYDDMLGTAIHKLGDLS